MTLAGLGGRILRFAQLSTAFITLPLVSRITSSAGNLIPPKVMLLSVYRSRNASTLLPLIDEARERDWDIRLWALDEIHPWLRSHSLGAGPGPKFHLLNELMSTADFRLFDWVVVLDDDFSLERGSVDLFLRISQVAGLEIAQPAHCLGSYRSHTITEQDPLAVARLTTFVEIGPLFAVSRARSASILPFPNDMGMGWGLDLLWSDLRGGGAHLGIVDLVTIRHRVPPGNDYSTTLDVERQRLQHYLQKRGFGSLGEMQRTLAVWRPWQRRAPW